MTRFLTCWSEPYRAHDMRFLARCPDRGVDWRVAGEPSGGSSSAGGSKGHDRPGLDSRHHSLHRPGWVDRAALSGRRRGGSAHLPRAEGRLKDAEEELWLALEAAIGLGNPPQLCKTHAAIGELRRTQGKFEDARRAFSEALSIMERVAASLTDERMRRTFLASKRFEETRRAAEAVA